MRCGSELALTMELHGGLEVGKWVENYVKATPTGEGQRLGGVP